MATSKIIFIPGCTSDILNLVLRPTVSFSNIFNNFHLPIHCSVINSPFFQLSASQNAMQRPALLLNIYSAFLLQTIQQTPAFNTGIVLSAKHTFGKATLLNPIKKKQTPSHPPPIGKQSFATPQPVSYRSVVLRR